METENGDRSASPSGTDASPLEARGLAVGTFVDTTPVPDHIREVMRENSKQLESVTKKASC